MVQVGKWSSPLPGGANISYGSSTTVRMEITSPITKLLKTLKEPNIIQRMIFRPFGAKNCSHYITVDQGSPYGVSKILNEHGIEYSRFGIDRTTYFCFDLASVTHMRMIQ